MRSSKRHLIGVHRLLVGVAIALGLLSTSCVQEWGIYSDAVYDSVTAYADPYADFRWTQLQVQLTNTAAETLSRIDLLVEARARSYRSPSLTLRIVVGTPLDLDAPRHQIGLIEPESSDRPNYWTAYELIELREPTMQCAEEVCTLDLAVWGQQYGGREDETIEWGLQAVAYGIGPEPQPASLSIIELD